MAEIAADSFKYFGGNRLQCGDFVIMPNHIHWIVTPLNGFELEEIMRSIDRFTSTMINRELNRSGRLWKKEPCDHLIREMYSLDRRLGEICLQNS